MSASPHVGCPWVCVGSLERIPRRGARVVETLRGPVAVFRTADDEVFALDDRCPHQGGPLSQGLVHGRNVACPLHDTVVCLASGRAEGNPSRARSHAVRVVAGSVYLAVDPGLGRTSERRAPMA